MMASNDGLTKAQYRELCSAVHRILGLWKLNRKKCAVFLGVKEITFDEVNGEIALLDPTDELTHRLLCLFGIWVSLKTLIQQDQVAVDWLYRRNKHPIFIERPPIELLDSGEVRHMEKLYHQLQYIINT